MNQTTTRRRHLRPWRTLIAGASLAAAPALGLLALAVCLIRADWKAGRL